MTWLLLVGVAAIVGVLLLRAFIVSPPADLARKIKFAGGVVLLLIGAGLLLGRQFALALPVGVAGLMILRRQAAIRTAARPASSRVSSAGLDMILDHATGNMDGVVRVGPHEGRPLSQLNLAELLSLAAEFSGDADSLRLLESYLDRTQPAWREHVQGDQAGRRSAPPGSGRMSAQEAYEFLGLEPGAGEAEVREAHRRLMKQVHPDRGGSAALAAKVNEAKDRILADHG